MDIETEKKIDTYNERKVDEVIELEIKFNDKVKKNRKLNFLRKSALTLGVLASVISGKEIIYNNNPSLIGFGAGLISLVCLPGFLWLKGKKETQERDLSLLEQNHESEMGNLDLSGLKILDIKRKELGLRKK